MLRLLFLVTMLAVAACHREPRPVTAAEAPPLPPSSGTPIGYLLDNASTLELRSEQIDKLRRIDNGLAARNDSIDTQLREIERPEQAPPPPKGEMPARESFVPGQQPMTSTADTSKLHEARAQNSREALADAFAVLDPAQQTKAKELLDARGIKSPTAAAPATPATE